LGCPFGCATSHRKAQSAKRSKEYYSSGDGKKKKKALNRKRFDNRYSKGNICFITKSEENNNLSKPFFEYESFVSYLHFLVCALENRHIFRSEIVSLIQKVRQHSLESWP
jgi:hypothetical protein